jgi:hypothetical protein
MKKHLKAITATGSAVAMYLSSAVVTGVHAAVISDIQTGPGYATDIGKLISFVLRVVLAIGALLVFGYLVMGGIEYITSGGEKGKTESARNKITAAIVGLIILAASWAILNLALSFLGLNSLTGAINSVGNINNAGTPQ